MITLLKSVSLLESITHLEDLPLKEFIRTIESLGEKIVTEKLDGTNLWFGVDEKGVYTSREGKSPKKGRFYNVSDIAAVANYNSFRAAHQAVMEIQSQIKKFFQVGDSAEIEVLFGRQPNTVTYGVSDKNFIVILRGVNGTPDERVQALAKAVNNKTVRVAADIISSPDGNELESNSQEMTWEFTQVKPVDSKKIDTKGVNKLLSGLKDYMSETNEALGKTNEEVAELSLTSVPKDQREAAKEERARVIDYIMTEFKAPIKELLLNKFVRKIKPFLQSDDLHPSEDIGVEGVVVRDPVSGSMAKIVDKDVFTAINSFNSSTRNSISGLVRTTDQDAAIEMRGGTFGQAKIRIAELLGAKELAMSSGTKRFVSKFKADSAEQTAAAIGKSLNISSLAAMRTKISAILKNTLTEINKTLDDFKKGAEGYSLELKTGKTIGLTPEVMKKTLTAFAETKKDIQEINSRVLGARSPADLVIALYGRTIESLFDGETEVKESFSLLKSIVEDGEAAGGEGGSPVTQTAAPATGTIASTAISPMAFKVGDKRIVKRTRGQSGWTKKKKFAKPTMSLLKSMNENWAHADDMKFATDVDDKTTAKSDIEFSQLRNNVTVGTDVTTMDVNRYLDKAHEINDEVDTVTFGLETDDGSIAKVYVNATQADEFEAALAEILGKEDDIEAAIDSLAEKFDIIDVEWPEAMIDQAASEFSDTEIEGDTGGSDQIHFGTDDFEEETSDEFSDEPPADEETTGDEPPADEEPVDGDEPPDEENTDQEFDGTSDEPPADDEPVEGDEPSADEETPGDEPVDGDEPPADEDEFEEPELDDQGNPLARRKKKKKQPTEESMKTLGQKFAQSLLEAKSKDDGSEEDQRPTPLDSLLENFQKREEKAIIKLMVKLGTPVDLVERKIAAFKEAIKPVASTYVKDNSLRVLVKRFISAIESVSEGVDATEKQLKTIHQRIIFGILEKLGINDAIVNVSNKALVTGVKSVAALIATENAAKMQLIYLAKELGVDTTGHPSDVTEQYVAEAVVDSSAVITDLLKSLGFDPLSTRSIASQMKMPGSKRIQNKLASATTVAKKMEFVTQLIQKFDLSPNEPASQQMPGSQQPLNKSLANKTI